MRGKILFLAILSALVLTAPASADEAMVEACIAKPSSLPHDQCVCFAHELRRVLTADEMRLEILAFKGKFMELRHKADAMGAAKAQSFTDRVAAVIGGGVCNK